MKEFRKNDFVRKAKHSDPDFQKIYSISTKWLQMKLNKATQEQIWS